MELALVEDLMTRRVTARRGGGGLIEIHKLVDVFFYESHNDAKTMRAYWGESGRGYSLNASYALFTRLRRLGVLAHSWI